METKRPQFGFFPIVVVLFCLLLAGCGGILEGEDDAPSISAEIVDLADGIFSLIGLVFDSDSSDPTLDTTYPAGMTVTWVTPDVKLVITLADFSPPDDTSGVKANGSIGLTRTSAAPLSIALDGTVNLTGHKYGKVVISGSAVWAAGIDDPSDDDPESVTGTFAVDGKSYSIADLIAAIDDADDDGGTAPPTTIYPLPPTFMTANGNYTQNFASRAWRLGPAATGDRWADYSYIKFGLSGDGARHAVYQGGVETAAGYINWYTLAGSQKLDFLNLTKTEVLHSFAVLSYTPTYLHLRGTWGGETREWIFTAGIGNFCGLVLDSTDSASVGGYTYYPPVANAAVEFGTYSGGTFVGSGVTSTTTAEGLFVFPDLYASHPGEAAGVRVTASGYAIYTSVELECGYITPDQVYKTVLLTTP